MPSVGAKTTTGSRNRDSTWRLKAEMGWQAGEWHECALEPESGGQSPHSMETCPEAHATARAVVAAGRVRTYTGAVWRSIAWGPVMVTPNRIALAFMAHPDDAEFLCAGTLIRLAEAGWEIHIATARAGRLRHDDREPLGHQRPPHEEAAAAAALIGATYHCLDERDGFVVYDKPTLQKTYDLFRRIAPSLVFTHAPKDYMIDHEQASLLARAASFLYAAPNVLGVSGAAGLGHAVPVLLRSGRGHRPVGQPGAADDVGRHHAASGEEDRDARPATPASASGSWPITAWTSTSTRCGGTRPMRGRQAGVAGGRGVRPAPRPRVSAATICWRRCSADGIRMRRIVVSSQ